MSMSEQDTSVGAPEEIQDTHPSAESAPEAVEAGTRAEDAIDWAKRYNDLRPEFDRAKQRLAELESFVESLSDPETQAEALAAFGLEVEPEDGEAYDDDELAALRRELEELKGLTQSQLEAQQAAEAEEAFIDSLDRDLGGLQQEIGRELDDEEIDFIAGQAYAQALRGETPDVKSIWQTLEGIYAKRQRQWVESKKAPRVLGGQSASKQPDLLNRKERLEYAARRLEDLNAE
jgi:hypothetical protein